MVSGRYFFRRMQVCESTSKQMNPWCAKKQQAVQDFPVRLSSFP
jgi:pyrroloquinoline quinone (PQQ) biosynthesis protein C